MNCPNCNIEIDFTWSRYFKCTPFVAQSCPDCSTKFKFKRPFTYYVWQLYTFLGFLGILCISDRFFEDNLFVEIFLIILFFVIYCIIDRDIESKLPTKSN